MPNILYAACIQKSLSSKILSSIDLALYVFYVFLCIKYILYTFYTYINNAHIHCHIYVQINEKRQLSYFSTADRFWDLLL